MPKKATSQWEFGELFPAGEFRKILTVAELTAQVRRVLEAQVGSVWVSGEVTNLRAQASGHIYFAVKDAAAQLSCVVFRGDAKGARELLEDGRKVLLKGDLTVYEPRGQYQLRVTEIELQGAGALQLAFERLKQKLQAEGLFETVRKRPLPRFPAQIGVVTSPTGAAIRDVVHVIERRNPALRLVLAPCRVQGQGAGEEIAAAINLLNCWSAERLAAGAGGLDLILVTRGGGSLEDLWAFNEEVVARAIYQSSLPVVSAVGHEIDFTISDFVADVRAATPSVAAALLTEAVVSVRPFLDEVGARLGVLAARGWERGLEALESLEKRLRRAHPRMRLNEIWQRLDDVQVQLLRNARLRTRRASDQWSELNARLRRVRLAHLAARRGEKLASLRQQLLERTKSQITARKNAWTRLAERLRLLSPTQVLSRGYSITIDEETGRVIRSAVQVEPGRVLRTKLHQGEVRSISQ